MTFQPAARPFAHDARRIGARQCADYESAMDLLAVTEEILRNRHEYPMAFVHYAEHGVVTAARWLSNCANCRRRDDTECDADCLNSRK